MDLDSIECVSSSDGLDEDEIHLHHTLHPYSLSHHHPELSATKPRNGSNNSGIAVPTATAPATSVHELLECPVCTNSMYPPIHQVCLCCPSYFQNVEGWFDFQFTRVEGWGMALFLLHNFLWFIFPAGFLFLFWADRRSFDVGWKFGDMNCFGWMCQMGTCYWVLKLWDVKSRTRLYWDMEIFG